jgi:subtilisin family serine protease
VLKVLERHPETGGTTGYLSDVISAMDWIVDNHAQFPSLKFVTLSLVANTEPSPWCPCDALKEIDGLEIFDPFTEAIARALAEDIRFVSPTGNDGTPGSIFPPACFDGVVGVGASYDARFVRAPAEGSFSDFDAAFRDCYNEHTTTMLMACFSNYGPCMDFVAPGYNITSTQLGGGERSSFGTSMSAAHVVGALALLQQCAPNLAGRTLLDHMARTAVPIPAPGENMETYPRIHVEYAVDRLLNTPSRHWSVYY